MTHSLIVNLSTGKTLVFDLSIERERSSWELLQRSGAEIRGLSVKRGKVSHALPVPVGCFSHVRFLAERVQHRTDPARTIGTRISLLADDISVSVLVYDGDSPPLVRTLLERQTLADE